MTVKLKTQDVALGSSDPHADHKQYSDIKYIDDSHHFVSMKSDQFVYTDSPSSPYVDNSLKSSSPYNCPPLSASTPISPSLAEDVPQFSSSAPTKFGTIPKSTPPTLVKRFHDLIKYVNIPDVLHGLENFGYLSSDQSIDLFELLQEVRREIPELSKVLQYEEEEHPICTVTHVGVTCDSCLTTDICGTRYKCAVCPNFDMCEMCERKGLLTHDITHPRIKMLVPSDCTFEHTCKSFNAQGEKIATECSFAHIAKPPTSPPVSTPTYKKRQLQFTTLLKKKQQRDTMRKMHIHEVERARQDRMREEEEKREAEEKLREQERQLKEQEKQKEKELQQKNKQRGSLGGEQGKSILWGYFENLKKQNKYQNIVAAPTNNDLNATNPDPTSSIPSSTSSDKPIAISGNLRASTSSTCSSISSSLANSTTSNSSIPLSPPSIHISPSASLSSSTSSSSSSPSSSPSSTRAHLNIPSSRTGVVTGVISSRLQHEKSFAPASPECSPIFGRPALTGSLGSPLQTRASSLKQSTTIQQEIESDPEVETKSQKDLAEDTKSRRSGLTDVLRDMGLRFSSDSDESESDLSSEDEYEPPSPKKISEPSPSPSFFSSLRDLLK